MGMMMVLHSFTLGMQVFKQVLLLSLAITHIEGVACILLMVKDFHCRIRLLIIVRTLIMTIWIATSTCIEAILMGDMGIVCASYPISIPCLHNFLA